MICDFCDNTATYRQRHIVICAECFGYFTELMFKNWQDWISDGKLDAEPPMWVYNSDNKI